jgi:histidine ammonia-lyase
MTLIEVTGNDLRLDDVLAVARAGAGATLAGEARTRMQAGRATLLQSVAAGATVYGANTGVGAGKLHPVAADEEARFNRVMLTNHRIVAGPDAPPDLVRATLLRLANHLATGRTGVRPVVVDHLLAALDTPVPPRMRMYGSLGLGDIGPLTDLALDTLGDVELAASEGLALFDNNAFGTASAALAVADCARLVDTLDAAAALDLEGFAASLTVLHPAVAATRPYPGLAHARARLAAALAGSALEQPGAARNLQDPISFRSAPQIQGAVRDVLDGALGVVAIELNAFQGNPLVLAEEGRAFSVGQFEILPLTLAIDALRQALATALTAQLERLVKQLQAPFNGLTRGLRAHTDGGEPGLEMFTHGCVSLVAEARLLAAPVANELPTTSLEEGIEDRMSFAPTAARRLAEMVALGERVVACALIVAAQAIDARGLRPLGAGTSRLHALVRSAVPAIQPHGTIPDIGAVEALVHAGDVAAIARAFDS